MPSVWDVNQGDLFTGIDFDTVIYLSVKPRLLMKNVDFSNRQRLKIASEIIHGTQIKVTASNALIIFDYY